MTGEPTVPTFGYGISRALREVAPVRLGMRATENIAGAFLAGYAVPRTRMAYRADLADFFDWCASRQLRPSGAAVCLR